MSKPPAFQFYVKDWRSSPTVARMSRKDKGDYIELLAAAWESDEPGTLPLPIEIAAKSARLDPRVVRNFVSKYGGCFEEIDGKLVNKKLRDQWLALVQHAEHKRDAANTMWAKRREQDHATAVHVQYSAFASSSASATAPKVKCSTSNTNSQERDQLGVRANGQKPPFAPPTHEQVTSYMQERGIPDAAHQAELFIAHHENRQWKLNSGRGARMKNWHLAVVTWQENIQKFASNGNGNRETKNEQARRKTREAAERVRADLGLDY